jgi:small subunit ribosomal protein S1
MNDEPINNNDDTEENKSFAELFEESFKRPVRLEPGQKIETRIVKITEEWIFLDLGGKSEGYLDKKELLNEDGALRAHEGDTISAYFLSSQNNEKLFTTRVRGGAAGNQFLEDAFHNHIPIEAVVEKEIKGGYEIKIAGSLRGFCPYSQMGLHRTEDPQLHIGKKLLFKISEYRDNGRTLVLSNRKILEEEREQKREELKGTLKKDMVVKGVVTTIRPFGAFVDIGGIEGLLPISEIGWSRVEDISTIMAPGQEIEVKILELDWDKNRFSFSLKAALPDPWLELTNRFPEGSIQTGTVSRLAPFGAFINLAPGIDGLIHISQLGQGKRISHPREAVAEGQPVEVRVLNVDSTAKRISLALAAASPQQEQEDDFRSYIEKQHAPKSSTVGAFGEALLKAREEKHKKRR